MPNDTAGDAATRVFAGHRELLFSVVYNMLGSVADTEDVLQDAWLAWVARSTAPDAAEIENPRAYLVRVAVNTALSRQATISRRRESYVGPWLPEPLVSEAGADESAERTEAVSIALLVVLETLTPLERAVFVLNELFGYAPPRSRRSWTGARRRSGGSRTGRGSTCTRAAPVTRPTRRCSGR